MCDICTLAYNYCMCPYVRCREVDSNYCLNQYRLNNSKDCEGLSVTPHQRLTANFGHSQQQLHTPTWKTAVYTSVNTRWIHQPQHPLDTPSSTLAWNTSANTRWIHQCQHQLDTPASTTAPSPGLALPIFFNNNNNKKVKSSMARSLPVENLLPQNVESIFNYLQ